MNLRIRRFVAIAIALIIGVVGLCAFVASAEPVSSPAANPSPPLTPAPTFDLGPAPSVGPASIVPAAPYFEVPSSGMIDLTDTQADVSWSVPDGFYAYFAALTRSSAPTRGSGCASSWTAGEPAVVGGRSSLLDHYSPGHCYRYQLEINGNPALSAQSGILRVAPAAAKIPVLEYHLVDPVVGRNLAHLVVAPAVFRAEMAALHSAGWRSITAAELAARLNAHAYIPERTFVATFDDGHKDDYLYAAPILREFGYVGTFYLITGRSGGSYINWDEAAELARAGNEIGSHTVAHNNVARASVASMNSVIAGSRAKIETELAARGISAQVTTFCYPYGSYSGKAENYLRSHGWAAAFIQGKTSVRRGDDMMALPRIEIPRSYNAAALLAAIARS